MNNLLSLIIAILLIGWLIGYLGFGEAVGNLIHILLVLAIVAILYRVITGKRL
ncbi:MAG: lmo0937 family membrane protein [Chitinophagales bacterium]